jgi:hypothetical protein
MSDAMLITTIRKTFPDEWVTAQVTDVDEADVPVAGVVLSHSPDKQTVFQAVKSHRAVNPRARLYTFFTGDVIPEGLHLAFPLG